MLFTKVKKVVYYYCSIYIPSHWTRSYKCCSLWDFLKCYAQCCFTLLTYKTSVSAFLWVGCYGCASCCGAWVVKTGLCCGVWVVEGGLCCACAESAA